MYRRRAAEELSKFLSVIAHPDRILIIEELSQSEMDVTSIQDRVHISQATTSRHLSLLKSHGIVEERKEGRHVFYHLVVPILTMWLIEGLEIVGKQNLKDVPLSRVVSSAKRAWTPRA